MPPLNAVPNHRARAVAILFMLSAMLSVAALTEVHAQQSPAKDAAVAGMKRASRYYVDHVASRGGYVYHYTLDLRTRWGEGLAGENVIWVQPPGTPTVGLAFLAAYDATGDMFYLGAARDAAEAIAYGQLRSGGWTNSIDLTRMSSSHPYQGGTQRRDGNSSLDDGQTQEALRFIMHTDAALEFKHPKIHESAQLGIRSLLAAQFPNGGFPQVWTKPVESQAIVRANYPAHNWRTEGRVKEYWNMYTLNDNVCGFLADTLWDAHRIYQSQACLNALKRLGDFLLLAQMPEPQPAWAQQYNYAMQPIWARRFEPAAIAGDESQEIVETLMKIAELTGDLQYLKPIPAALDYLERSKLADGQLARYYELRTNKPLYMSRKGKAYSLTYDDSNLPSHYGWKWPSRVVELRAAYQRQLAGKSSSMPSDVPLSELAARALSKLDSQSRWISTYTGERLVGQPEFARGDMYLSSEVFSENLTTLSRFVKQQSGEPE